MALAIDASSPTIVTNAVSGTAALATGSFTPPAASLLVAMWACNASSGVDPAAPSIAGGSLTWTLQRWKHRGDGVTPAVDGQAAVWTAVPTGAALTATVTSGSGANHNEAALGVQVMTDSSGIIPRVGTVGSASSTTSTTTVAQAVTGTANSSWPFMVVDDWTASSATAQTAGTGTTLLGSARTGATNQISWGLYRRTLADDTAGGSVTVNATLPAASTNLSWLWVEIIAAPIPTLVMARS